MTNEKNRVLVLNPGATSTKFGVYTEDGVEWEHTIRHGDDEIERFRGKPMLARLDYRAGLIEHALAEAGYAAQAFAAAEYCRRCPAAPIWWMRRWLRSCGWRAAVSTPRTWARCWHCASLRPPA